MTRKVFAIYKDGTVKEILTPKMAMAKVESVYDVTKWIADHEEDLKVDAKSLYWEAPVLGFNLSGVIGDSLRKKIVKPMEL